MNPTSIKQYTHISIGTITCTLVFPLGVYCMAPYYTQQQLVVLILYTVHHITYTKHELFSQQSYPSEEYN